MLDRLVTQIEPPPDHIARQAPQTFRDFLSGHTIILLGDPGVGKTHLFQHAAQYEGAEYTTVRQFVIFEGENCKGKTVYLDALDEFRSRSDNKDKVAELVRIVRSLGRPKMRLSCRAADWLGNTDMQDFQQLTQDSSFLVLRLEPLTEAQILHSNRHGWNAAEFVRWQIEALSAEPSEEAGEALVTLADSKKLTSYGDHLRHAIANQAKIRRQQHYAQPDWDKTVATLRGGQPANIADLYALASDHLRTLCVAIHHSNDDIYKHFWELSQQSGSIQRPQHEEVCCDRLIGLLRPRLLPLRIFTEPEGHMAADKRADMVLYHGSDLKLPIEVKRHTHKDLWTACAHQLDRLYAQDPHAAGFGIYLVFWFGEDRGGQGPSPPQGMPRPDSATTLEQALRSRIPEDKTYCLDVIVLDVTPPAATKKARTKSGRQK